MYSFEEICEKYGSDFNIFVTLSQKKIPEAIAKLIDRGVSRERILNFDGYKYKSCQSLRNDLRILNHGLTPCCTDVTRAPYLPWKEGESYESMLVSYGNMRHDLLEALKRGEKTKCDGCIDLRDEVWTAVPEKFSSVCDIMTRGCQLSCIYCCYGTSKRIASDFEKKCMKLFDFKKFITALLNLDLISPIHSTIVFIGGEPSLLPDGHFDIIKKLKWPRFSVFTNAVKFDARTIAASPTSLTVSVDAGTRETYITVKGLDSFDQVWKNIKAYIDAMRSFGGIVTVKYIFLPENCTHENVSGFAKMVVDAGVRNVTLSADWDKDYHFSNDQLKIISKLIVLLRKHDISFCWHEFFMLKCPDEFSKIEEYCNAFSLK